MKTIAITVTALLVTGCVGMADYLGPPPGVEGANAIPVDPESVKVDPTKFPQFRVVAPVSPPRWTSQYDSTYQSRFPMVDIVPTDEWVVRHTVGELFLIVSDAYNQRQCKSLLAAGPGAGCFGNAASERVHSDYLYAIFIARDGRVSGGWKLLRNPERVVLSSERRTYLAPAPWGNKGWESLTFREVR